MSVHLRIQRFGESRARLVRTRDAVVNIVDGALRLRLLGLQPGESVARPLVTYESADCKFCDGEGGKYTDCFEECEACGGHGIHVECAYCGEQITVDDEPICKSCERDVEYAHARGAA